MRQRGFTLVELVVSIALAGVVMVFTSMFMAAPISAYQSHSRRTALTADAVSAWPQMEQDLRGALPNSLRARRNGNFVVLEMLSVVDVARYMAAPSAAFNVAGTMRNVALPFASTTHYLSVNNLGLGAADAYGLAGSMTPAGANIQISAAALPGENLLNVNPAPVFAADSPRHLIYLVSGPVTWLCDEGAGTLRRYANYAIAANQAARDAPADFTGIGAVGTLVAQGLTTCDMNVSAVTPVGSQTAAIRFTVTRNNETVTTMHAARADFVP